MTSEREASGAEAISWKLPGRKRLPGSFPAVKTKNPLQASSRRVRGAVHGAQTPALQDYDGKIRPPLNPRTAPHLETPMTTPIITPKSSLQSFLRSFPPASSSASPVTHPLTDAERALWSAAPRRPPASPPCGSGPLREEEKEEAPPSPSCAA